MANQKITDYAALTGAGVDATADLLEIVDFNVLTNKKILVSELAIAMQGSTTVVGTGQFATAAVTLTGTDATKLLTPGGFAGNKSLGTNGFYKFPGGLIIQWGVAVTDGTGTAAVTFPTAFPNALFTIVISELVSASRGAAAVGTSVSGFTAQSSASVATTLGWIAIGN